MVSVKRHRTEHSRGETTSVLQVYLLGTPRIEGAGGLFLAIPRRQARALLYRLAVQPQTLSREHLCFLFWPDTPETTARRNLSRLLTHLRRALPAPEMLVTSGDRVELDPHLTWSDTALLGRLVALQDTRRQAVDLYRGPFLSDFSLSASPEFEAWVTQERECWERLYLETLAALIESETTSGEYTVAIDHAQRYLETDDLAEDIHCCLIELYALTGNRSAALRQFERCVTVLERELGVSPLPETQAAYRVILEGRSSPRVARATELAWATLPSLDVPLLGREGVLDRLERAYAKVCTGHGRVVLISGEAGIGKSRLMQDFATGLQNQTLVLAGTGYPDAQTMPYQPIAEALRLALGVKRSRFEAQVAWLAEASRLMPELCDVYPDLPPPMPLEPDQARARLFEALCQLILGLAAGSRPVLLCLDDLHWADSATLDWLAYLGRRLQKGQLLVIGTYRSEETRAVAELRHGLTRQGVLSELKLVGLDETAVLELLRHLKSVVPDSKALAGRLKQVTGGNPFFLLETLRALIESGQRLDEPVNLKDLPVPDTVRDAVKTRTERLSPKARQVLETGAVLGQAFVFDTVCLTAGRREMETMDGLDELVARQLLTEQTTAYRFCHEMVRETVYRELGHWRRRLLHRRAGEALEKLQPDGAAALAWHFERAEEPDRAARHALKAGQAAKSIFAHTEARAHFDRALALLEQEAARLQDTEAVAANQRLRIQALYARGWALRLLGDMEAYASDLHGVARLAKSLGDPRTLAHLRYREAYTHRWFCHYAEALESAKDGLRLGQMVADSALEAMCQREVGLAARAVGDYDRARTALERSLNLFVELGEIVYEIHAHSNLATLYWYMGEYDQVINLSRRTLTRCDQAGLPFHRRLPLGDMGAAAAAAGDGELARSCLLESLSIAHQIADRTQEIFCLGHLGWLCVREKKAAEALEHLRVALALAESIGSCAEQSWLLSGLAEAHDLIDERDQALAQARRALDLAEASGQIYHQKLACKILGRVKEG